jgi:hypothetical protein
LATITPIISAKVLTISKYNKALPPTLPTFFISLMPAMPSTIVKNIIGPINIVIRLINILLITCAVGPNDLKYRPAITPSKIPTITWKLRLRRSFFINQLYEYSLCYGNSAKALLKKSVRPVHDMGQQDIITYLLVINKKLPSIS